MRWNRRSVATAGGARRAWLVLWVLAAACAAPENAPTVPAAPLPPPGGAAAAQDEQDIRRLLAELARAESDEDLAAVVALYADDALWLGPEDMRAAGQEQIRAAHAERFTAYDLTVEIEAGSIEQDGEMARIVGTTHRRQVARAGGEVRQLRERFVMVLQRTEPGLWRVARLAWQPMR